MIIGDNWSSMGAHWGSLEIIWYWDSLGMIGTHWGSLGITGAHCEQLEFVGAHWG